jgi:hypothetical protein
MKDWKHPSNVLPVCGLPDILNFWLRAGNGFGSTKNGVWQQADGNFQTLMKFL